MNMEVKTPKKGVPPNEENPGLELHRELLAKESLRLVRTIDLRSELLAAAIELLPEAIRQAKPHVQRIGGRGRKRRVIRKPGSPALLRLIARIAMKPVRIESNSQNPWSPNDPDDKP